MPELDLRYSELVYVNGLAIGIVTLKADAKYEAVLWRPRAESDKVLGLFPSKTKARLAVKIAAAARASR